MNENEQKPADSWEVPVCVKTIPAMKTPARRCFAFSEPPLLLSLCPKCFTGNHTRHVAPLHA